MLADTISTTIKSNETHSFLTLNETLDVQSSGNGCMSSFKNILHPQETNSFNLETI